MSLRFADPYDDDSDNTNILIPCEYSEIEHIDNTTIMNAILHINIHSLPAKHDQLQTLITRPNKQNINVDFVLLCETLLNDRNHGWIFVYK